MSTALRLLRVHALTWEAEGILGIELRPLDPAGRLPVAEAGAHVDLHLGNGLVRSYSLIRPGEHERWCIAVNLDAASRGGSRWLHESLRPGAVLQADGPRNHFMLREDATHSVLIAGGIGITPLLAMARRLTALGRPWTLHYAARRRAQMAFVAELRSLAEQAGARLDLRCDQEPGAADAPLDLDAIVAALPAGAHVYACGPAGLLDAFEAATAALPRERVHLERFAGVRDAAPQGGFELRLARSGRSLQVAAGQSILDALLAIGIEPPHSCREGVCGTCETQVLCGVPEHRDLVLSDAEKAEGRRMMICCSGAKTPMIELDL
ncbi:MAG: oxidoreductase [Burkholderiaceae bacterium]|nr:oxidoreductase [Burkholderiaceae bacterium]